MEKVCSERYVSRVQAMVRCCGGLVATQWCRCLQYSWPLRLRTRINSPLELRSGRVMARWTRLLEAVAAVQLPGPTATVETVCAMRMRFWSCTHELIDLQILRFCWCLETCNQL